MVYIHGGYWQELSKNESCLMAPGLVEQGFNVAVIDYTLAPVASISHMIAQCCRAVAWLLAQAQRLGFNTDCRQLCGRTFVRLGVTSSPTKPARG